MKFFITLGPKLCAICRIFVPYPEMKKHLDTPPPLGSGQTQVILVLITLVVVSSLIACWVIFHAFVIIC